MGDVSKRKDFNQRIKKKGPRERRPRYPSSRPIQTEVLYRTETLLASHTKRHSAVAGCYALSVKIQTFPRAPRLTSRLAGGNFTVHHLNKCNKGKRRKRRHCSPKTIFRGAPGQLFRGSKSLTCRHPDSLSAGPEETMRPSRHIRLCKLTQP